MENKKFEIFSKKKLKKILFFFEYFFAYSAVPHQIHTTGKKNIKIHQVEQILGKCPYAGSMWGEILYIYISLRSCIQDITY